MKPVHSNKDTALSAFDVLNTLMGEIHAGRTIAVLAEKKLGLFQTNHREYFVRIGEGAVFLALSKFADLWDYHILTLLGDDAPSKGHGLRQEVKRKKTLEFRDLFVAHYSDREANPGPTMKKLQELTAAQGFKNAEELESWVGDAVVAIEDVRTALAVRFNLQKKK